MSENQQPDNSAEKSVKKGTGLVVVLILLSAVWYLASDRFTPYTQQARIQGYVVGVSPKVSGVVTRVLVKNDQQVEDGQTLFEIDRDQYDIALKKAQSDYENAITQMDAGTASVASARANLLAAEANELKARQDSTRQERLYKEDSGTISVRRLEIARATLQQAKAKVVGREADVQRAIEQKGGEGDSNVKLKTALTAVEKAKLDLGNTVVKASSRGVITDLRADVGLYAGAGKPVMTLISMHDIWINAEFTENNLGNLKIGTPVELVLDVLPGEIFTGKVRSIGLGIAAGQAPAPGSLPTIDNSRDWLRPSQRYPVVIEFDPGQREQLNGFIRLGGQAEVMAFTEGHGILKVLGKMYIRMMSWLSFVY